MIAQGVEFGIVNFVEVGALGVASADQSVELFDATFVTGAVGPGKEHAAGPVQPGGDLGVTGKLPSIIQGE